MNTAETLKSLHMELDSAKLLIERADQLKRLKNNRDFKTIFLKEYCEKDVLRLVGLLPTVEKEQRQHVIRELECISRLNHHMDLIERMGRMAADNMPSILNSIQEEENGVSVEDLVEG